MYETLVHAFMEEFGTRPSFLVRMPGRVNLIGEHTDYNGLPVMPMAIEREVLLVVAPREDQQVEVHSLDDNFAPRRFTLASSIPHYPMGDWGNYIKAGVQGAMQYMVPAPGRQLRGFTALVAGDLPMAAGLSSSSAMVVASALAAIASNDMAWDRHSLAEAMSAAERYVGTMGGGMDQAAVLLSEPGCALKIDFFPLRAVPVRMPSGYSVVVCNSLVHAPKTAEARLEYNRRPIECRMAAAVLARRLNLMNDFPDRLSQLLTLMTTVQLAEGAEAILGPHPWSAYQVAQALGLSKADLEDEFMRLADGEVLPSPSDGFPLLSRVRHVLWEGERVNLAAQALSVGKMDVFGRLMNESHASCRDNYGISCPELEALVTTARRAGALGSRLTGAGFGGCTVSVVPGQIKEDFVATVIADYYEGYLKQERPDLCKQAKATGYRDIVIASLPANGGEVVPLVDS